MVEKFDVWMTPFTCERKVHVYLPENYYQSNERYPVVYMYDGHNLFHDEDATYGKSWGLETFMDHYDKKVIIVGIECNHTGNERLNEYCPYDVDWAFRGPIQGRGKLLMGWMVQEFKPMIDRCYRTIPFRECTAIGGSSMGGLMALYTVIAYNQYFSKAACISPANSICQKELQEEFFKASISADTRVYFSFGTKEARNVSTRLRQLRWFEDAFSSKGGVCMINVVEGGEHNEASWEKENPIYFDFLWKNKKRS